MRVLLVSGGSLDESVISGFLYEQKCDKIVQKACKNVNKLYN